MPLVPCLWSWRHFLWRRPLRGQHTQGIFMPESGILGTSVNECSAILARHGAVQAMNVDGGTSAILWYDGQCVTRCCNLALPSGRALPNAFVYHKRTD